MSAVRVIRDSSDVRPEKRFGPAATLRRPILRRGKNRHVARGAAGAAPVVSFERVSKHLRPAEGGRRAEPAVVAETDGRAARPNGAGKPTHVRF